MTIDTYPDLLAKAAAWTPSKVALEEVKTGRRLTYAQLDEAASHCAGMLQTRGVGEGDRVAILCRNRIEFFECLFACVRLSAVLVPLNWRMPVPELAPIIDYIEPSLCLAGAEDAQLLTDALAGRDVPFLNLDDKTRAGYHVQCAEAEPFAHDGLWPADRVWYLLFTSGTTGKPKAVIQTCAMALVNYINIGRAIGLSHQDRTLNFLPLFHTAGINLHTLPTLLEGGTVLILPGFEARAALDLIAEGRIDTFFGVPTVYRALTQEPAFERVDLSSVRHWACGGAPLPDDLVRQYAGRNVMVCNGMGMTETGPTLFLMRPEDVTDKIGSIGKVQVMTEVRLVGEDGKLVSQGNVGEVQIRGPGITPGYWRDRQETDRLFTPDGWLRSGDLARQDADGFYYVAGRKKEMFISGGENVFPAEVEAVLAGHPSVEEAVVIAAPDDRWGQVGIAYVIPVNGEPLAVPELTAWCRARIAGFKVPARIEVVDDFPRTAAGKVMKHRLPVPVA